MKNFNPLAAMFWKQGKQSRRAGAPGCPEAASVPTVLQGAVPLHCCSVQCPGCSSWTNLRISLSSYAKTFPEAGLGLC